VVDPVAEHVEVLVGAVHRRDLRGGHHAHAVEGAGGQRLVHAVDRVVVGQRQEAHARRGGVLDYLGGGELPVGVERMGLEVEAHGAGRLVIRPECHGASCSL
jgi:hypothetical protein